MGAKSFAARRQPHFYKKKLSIFEISSSKPQEQQGVDLSILHEAIGAAATATVLSGLLFRDPRTTLKFTAAGLALWCLYFLVLQEYSGLVVVFVALLRSAAGAWLPSRFMTPVIVTCMAIILVGGVMTMDTWIAIFTLASGLVKAAASFLRDRMYAFRLAHIAGEGLNLPYAIGISAIALTISTLITLGIMLVSLAYFFFKEKATEAPA